MKKSFTVRLDVDFSYDFLSFLCIHVEMGGMCGRIIGLDQVFGREPMVGKSFPSVAVMMIRPLLIPQ